MRIATLLRGLTAYQEACYAQLHALGDELLIVQREEVPDLPFGAEHRRAVAERVITSDVPSGAELLPVIERFRPDVVIMSSWNGRGYRAVMRAMRGRALRVVFLSNFWLGSVKQRAGLVASRAYVAPLFDCAWVPGIRSELFARQLGFSGAQIIRGANSADTPTFGRGARAADELAARRQFVFTGRLVWHKAVEELAEAYRRYRAATPDPWALAVAGDGPLRAAVEQLPGTQVRGFLEPPAVAQLMHESSAFVLPSHAEWYGVVVHEAASAGLPLIVSDGVGSVPHLLQDGYNGWTIPAGDVAALAATMKRMSDVPPDRLAAMSAGSRALAGRLSPSLWARNLHEELERRLPGA